MRINIYSCPSCSSTINFRSADTNLLVCPQCSRPLERLTGDLLQPLNYLQLVQDTLTPVQIGTTGVWKERRFTVIGRIRCELDEDYTNYWSIYLEGGALHILSESYGHFAVYEKTTLDKDIPATQLKNLSFGIGKGLLNIRDKEYILERRNTCRSIEVEGESWVFDLNGSFTIHEVAAADGDRLALLDLELGKYLYFRIHHEHFETFNFQNLRSLPMGTVVKKVTCARCNNTIALKSFPLSQSFSCKHCNSAFSYRRGSLVFHKRMSLEKTPAIPLYSEGTLKGIEYELIGFAEKEDAEGYGWREYTLFNPVRGYAFLSEYAGHWIFLREAHKAPVVQDDQSNGFLYEGKDFVIFNKYTFSISNAQGEFPGDVFNDGAASCREFIAPPQMWARELHKQGISWYHGEHISTDELYEAFGNTIDLPYQFGVGAVQPVKGYVDLGFLRNSMIGIVVVFFVLFMLSFGANKNTVVYENTWFLQDTTTTYSIVTQKFTLDKWRSNMEVELTASVSNNWFETNVTLVNADDGKEYTLEQGVEYYSGYEDGESWSEGSSSSTAVFNTIPKGTYFMEIIGSKPVGASPDHFSIKATYDVPMPRNFFIFLIITLLPGLSLYLYLRYKERARWENSPFSPFPSKMFNYDE